MRRKDAAVGFGQWAVLSVLGILLVLYYGPTLWGGRVFPLVDASRFFYPVWSWGARVWGSGVIPLWNPDMACGSPFACDPQTASFYPPMRLAYAFLAPWTAFHALIAFHHGWALLGFWSYGRMKGWSAVSLLTGALAFGFSSTLVSSAWTPVALMAISWIPWVFLAGESLRQGKRWAGPALWAATALQVCAGYPVIPYLTGLALWMVLAVGGNERVPVKGWMEKVLAAQGLAALTGLVWLLPFLEILPLGALSPDGSVHAQALGWNALSTFLDPFALGHPLRSDYAGPPFWVASYFIGWPALGLTLWALGRTFFSKTFPKSAWVPLGCVLWLSLGETAFLGGWLKAWVPGWSFVIRSGFLLPLSAFFLSIWAARSMEDLMKRMDRARGFRLGAAVIILLGSGASLLFPAWGLHWTLPSAYYRDKPPLPEISVPGSRIFHTPPLQEGFYRLRGNSPEEAYAGAKSLWAPNWPLLFGVSEIVSYNTFGIGMPRWWMRDVFKVSPAQSRKALDFLGAGLLIGKSPLPGLKPIGEAAPDIPWLENPSAYPPWICVREGLWAPDPETEWRMMEKKGWNFKRVAFVDEPIGVGIFGVRDLTILREGVNRVLLRAPGIGRSLLVSSETNAPGWNVFSGGKKFVPLMVHHVFRGVILEEGTTEAEWRYEPATFRLGLFASLFSTGLGFAWLLLTLGTSAGSAKPLRGEAV